MSYSSRLSSAIGWNVDIIRAILENIEGTSIPNGERKIVALALMAFIQSKYSSRMMPGRYAVSERCEVHYVEILHSARSRQSFLSG